MKSLHSYLYLILGVFVVAATGKKPKAIVLKDVIWYPVDEEEGVFISIYGEKYSSKWPYYNYLGSRSILDENRGDQFNRDPIFSSLNVIRTDHSYGGRPKRESFDNSNFKNFRFSKKPFLNFHFDNPRLNAISHGQNSQNNNLQHQIPNREFPVFSFQNKWTRNVDFVGRPVAFVSNLPETSFQIENHPFYPSNGLNIQTNYNTNQFKGESFYDEFTFRRPLNQIRPHVPPNHFQFNQNSFNVESQIKPLPHRVEKPWSTGTPVTIVFPEENQSTRPPNVQPTFPGTTEPATQPTEPTTMSPCERRCSVTPEFNPICGSDSMTYTNIGRLKCAQNCGKAVRLVHYGTCRSSRLAMPPRWTRP